MKAAAAFGVFGILLFAAFARPQSATPADNPTPSEHCAGPNGLEGWTLLSPLPDSPQEKYPFTLVIARKGRIIRRIDGHPFVWRWLFWNNGRQVAYESGPLHFGLQCTLASVATGKTLATYDCFHGVPESAPDWLKVLETAP
jgi:hypothetical protein